MATPSCPRCSISLQEGFLLERSKNVREVTRWVEGKPERSFWLGLSLRGRPHLATVSYRCPRCGLLELYAPAVEAR